MHIMKFIYREIIWFYKVYKGEGFLVLQPFSQFYRNIFTFYGMHFLGITEEWIATYLVWETKI